MNGTDKTQTEQPQPTGRGVAMPNTSSRPSGRDVLNQDTKENSRASQDELFALQDEVKRLRAELKSVSHQASMAEVATGALHNVGNVLNSLSVSASLLADRLRQSRVPNLGKALALLHEHKANLAQFLTSDAKGKMLPGYLETLADHLAASHAEMVREMDSFQRAMEHVKEIVAVQQCYASKCGLLETLAIHELVQDAIRMNLGAFERHGIVLDCVVPEGLRVTVDRHKVLQILINLFRNAKYAMDELGRPDKRMGVRVAPAPEGGVEVSVSDNGVGIPPENLSCIFEHGFTTKRDGHGFGLHSGLIAARQMGGTLSAYSEGLGKGATFKLVLPLAKSERETCDQASTSTVG